MMRTDASGATAEDALSVASDSENEMEEHVMDPSDPRAHGRQNLSARAKQEMEAKTSSRWDSDADDHEDGEDEDEEEVDEDMGVPVQMDDEDDEKQDEQKQPVSKQSAEMTKKLKARLSNWAASRFLVPRSERPMPVLEEPPVEPLNDFILSDFGTRFRGGVQVETTKTDVDDDSDDDADGNDGKLQVGAPLYSADGASLDKQDPGATANGKGKPTDKNKDSQKRRPDNRYFITDLATKCFNCGQVGHMSAVCANDKLQKPCYYCGLRGHASFACPHLPCSACMQLGHEFRDCSNKRLSRSRNCALCGRAGHSKDNCDTSSRGGLPVTCMVCVEDGHLHCAPIPPPADRRMYCAYCAGNHAIAKCSEYVEPAPMSFTARLPRSDMKCFVCNTAGHIAAECPKRTNYSNSGGSCFNCGQRGHYASDCPAARSGGGNNNNNNRNASSGRKRGRNEYHADDDDDESYGRNGRGGGGQRGGNHTRYVQEYADENGGSEDEYYYVPGGGNRGGSSHKKARIDAALPSYRNNNNNSGNNSGYKGYNNNSSHNNGNQRGSGGGNGGGDRRRWR